MELGDPFWGNVLFLMHMDEQDLIDVKGHPLALNGTARSDTQSVFGGYSGFFNGASNTIRITSSDLSFTGDFCVDFFLRPSASTGCVFSTPSGDTSLYGANLTIGGQKVTSVSLQLSVGVWRHVAIFRIGPTVFVYKDGVSIAANVFTGTANFNSLIIGNYNPNPNGPFSGYIDDFRITGGVSRYSGLTSFTPPAIAAPEFSNTISGVVLDSSGSPSARAVRVYRRSDGALASTTTSDGSTGVFSAITLDTSLHYAVCLPPGTSENALIFDSITPT